MKCQLVLQRFELNKCSLDVIETREMRPVAEERRAGQRDRAAGPELRQLLVNKLTRLSRKLSPSKF